MLSNWIWIAWRRRLSTPPRAYHLLPPTDTSPLFQTPIFLFYSILFINLFDLFIYFYSFHLLSQTQQHICQQNSCTENWSSKKTFLHSLFRAMAGAQFLNLSRSSLVKPSRPLLYNPIKVFCLSFTFLLSVLVLQFKRLWLCVWQERILWLLLVFITLNFVFWFGGCLGRKSKCVSFLFFLFCFVWLHGFFY